MMILEEDSLFNEADAIRDNDIYLSNMSKSFADKAWFVKYIRPGITTVVDFGGGSGEFCQYVDRILSFRKRPMRYVVIDNNQEFAVLVFRRFPCVKRMRSGVGAARHVVGNP